MVFKNIVSYLRRMCFTQCFWNVACFLGLLNTDLNWLACSELGRGILKFSDFEIFPDFWKNMLTFFRDFFLGTLVWSGGDRPNRFYCITHLTIFFQKDETLNFCWPIARFLISNSSIEKLPLCKQCTWCKKWITWFLGASIIGIHSVP